MITKRASHLLSLLMFLVIGQAVFMVAPASASSHNCWRPPYCFLLYGTIEETPVASNLSSDEFPNTMLVANSMQAPPVNHGAKVLISTDSKRMEVDLDEDARTNIQDLKKEKAKQKGSVKTQGYMVVGTHDDGTLVLINFIPVDPHKPFPYNPIPPDDAWRMHKRVGEDALKKSP